MSSNLKVNSLVPATGTEIGIGTTGGSIDFRCPATFGGNVTIGGTLTYDEVINIDSIGVITARSNIDCNGSLDVDGHTNLDNVSIAGITTFSNGPIVPNGQYYRGIINSGSQEKIIGGYISGTDTLRIGESMYLTSNGLGIGENSPEEELHITAATPVIRLEDSDTSRQSQIVGVDGNLRFDAANNNAQADSNISFRTDGSERLRIDSSGRVLIGHNSSLAIGGGDISPLQVSATSAVVFGGVRYVNSSSGPFLSLSKSRATTAGSNTIVQSGDDLGTILFSGDDGTDLISKGAQIQAQVDGTPGSNDMPGRLIFSTTADGAASPTERLRITSSGQVGINKTPALASSKLEVGGADNYPLINVEASGATAGVGIGGGALQFFYGTSEKVRITSNAQLRLGNLGHSTSKVGGQAITAQDYDPYFKLYASTNNHWLMQLRSDTATGGNGIFLRSSNSSSNYSMFVTGYDESKPHIVARGDQRVGIGTTNPRTHLHVEGSIQAGTINTPFQRQFSKSDNHQRETKHYFRCVGGNQTFDIITVDLNNNFHQAVCEVLYGTRLQNISDSATQPNKIIFGINRFIGNTPSIHKEVLYQHTNAANHADINIVATSSSQYRVRLVMSSSCGGSSFCGGYVELIAVGNGSDGSFYSLGHAYGLLN